MKFVEDPRIGVGFKCFIFSWVYFGIYVLILMILSYHLGWEPSVLGLPRWIAIGNILFPIFSMIILVFAVGKFIPDIPLEDDDKENEEK